MKNLMKSLLLLTLTPLAALASSHREAPSIAKDPVADNTDVYAFMSPGTHDKVTILANYNGLQEPSGGPNFHGLSDDVLYQIHIARGATSLDDVVTYQFEFKTAAIPDVDENNQSLGIGGGKEFFLQLAAGGGGGIPVQTYKVTKIVGNQHTVIANNVRVAPPNIGPRTYAVAYKGQYASSETSYNDAFAGSFVSNLNNGEGTVFVGPRDDGFYVDLGGIFDLANLRAKGTAQDGVAGYNVSSIAIEIPTTKLSADGQIPTTPGNASTLGIWASASRRQVRVLHHDGDDDDFGPWIQVSRQGLPLINEAVIGLDDKDHWNRTTPKADVPVFGGYFLNPVIVKDAEAVGLYANGAPLASITPPEFNRTDILDIISLTNVPTTGAHSITAIGDVIRLDMATDSAFPNGRPLHLGGNKEGPSIVGDYDVTDVLLSVLLTKGAAIVSDGVDYNDKNFLSAMPYLALPWAGYDQGHGKPTP
jgi:hypothetical protein